MCSHENDSIEATTSSHHRLPQPDNESQEHASEDHIWSMHASCAHCKHFHRHIPFKLPKDDSEHKRFKCSVCEYPIVGIGRSSTQTTLASVDSIPPATDGRPRMTQKAPCTNRLPPIRINTLVNAKSTNRMTPLIEKSPIGPAEGHKQKEALSSHPIDTSLKSRIKYGPDTKPGVLHKAKPQRQDSKNTKRWSLTYAWDRMRSFKTRAKDRLLKREQVPHISRIKVSSELTSARSPPLSDVAHLAGTESKESENPHDMIASEGSAKPSDALDEPSAEHPFSKEERLRQFRRQKTLEKKALTQTLCECGKDCHCYPQHQSDPRERNGTITPQRSISTDAVPDHPLDPRPLTDPGSETSLGPLQLPSYRFGQQFPNSLNYPLRFAVPTSTDSDRSRDSQALTQVGSDASTSGSGRTMHGTRPASSTGFRTSASRSLRDSGSGSIPDRRSSEEARRHSPLNQAETSLAGDSITGRPSVNAANNEDDILRERRSRTT